MSYASRYTQRVAVEPPHRTKSPVASVRVAQNKTASPVAPIRATVHHQPAAYVRGGWSLSSSSAATRGQTERPSTPTLRSQKQARGHTANSSDAGLASAVSQKLRGFQELRHLMQSLADRHKKEESELQNLMKRLLVVRNHQVELHPASPQRKPEGDQHAEHQTQLQAAVEERDKAIAMLRLFREEGNNVMQRMHQSLRSAHEQHEELMLKVEKLTIENARMRYVVREVKYFAEDLKDEQATTTNGHEVVAIGEKRDMMVAKETISKLDELLQEADAVITSLRTQNEELLRQNETMRQRERRDANQNAAVSNSDDGTSESISDALNIDVAKADDETLAAYVQRVKQQLRTEKRHRLEAEELSHKLLIEHQKNVHLLEQRLMQRNLVGTPRNGGTPRKPTRGPSLSTTNIMAKGASVTTPPFEPQSSQASSSVGGGEASATNSFHPRVDSLNQASFEEEAALLLRASPSNGGKPPPPQTVATIGRGSSEELLVDYKHSPDVAPPMSSHEHAADNGNSEGGHDDEDPMLELRNIEAQLNEVVASLEES